MKTRSRVILIVTGVVIFAVAAPMAVFFAKGISYNFATGAFEKTGALVVRSEPRGADIVLDGDLVSKTPATKRFLPPKQYSLEISKPGYRVWKTQITIHSQMVTNPAPLGNDRIFLLSDTAEPKLTASSSSPFYENAERIHFIKQTNSNTAGSILQLWTMAKSSAEPILVSEHSASFTQPKIIQALGDEAIIQDSRAMWYLAKDGVFRLPNSFLLAQLGNKPETVLGLNMSAELVSYSPRDLQSLVLEEGVTEFTVSKENIYAIKAEDNIQQLIQLDGSSAKQVLFERLPQSAGRKILVSDNRHVFALLDRSLYRVGDDLQKINGDVDYARWDDNYQSLTYGNKNEAWLLQTREDQPSRLLTRNSNQLGPARYNEKIGYTVIRKENNLFAVEVSDSPQPNSYSLADVGTSDDYTINADGNQIIYQIGTEIYTLKIR